MVNSKFKGCIYCIILLCVELFFNLNFILLSFIVLNCIALSRFELLMSSKKAFEVYN